MSRPPLSEAVVRVDTYVCDYCGELVHRDRAWPVRVLRIPPHLRLADPSLVDGSALDRELRVHGGCVAAVREAVGAANLA
jgi:hypothetical protein